MAEIADKRLSECTPEEREQAHEDWLRNNCQWFMPDVEKHIRFLLGRLDKARKPHGGGGGHG